MNKILLLLSEHYPSPSCGLNFKTPWELLIATILAAQCTDKAINEITPVLFKKYPSAKELAKADLSDVEQIIKRSGFFRAKAKNIVAAAKTVVENFGGKVPQTMEKIVSIPGVARKTANVVMGNAMNNPQGITVDTHVLRVCFRLGLTKETKPEKVEADLMKIIPREQWVLFPNRIKLHGQTICTGKKPFCEKCFLAAQCPKIEYVKR